MKEPDATHDIDEAYSPGGSYTEEDSAALEDALKLAIKDIPGASVRYFEAVEKKEAYASLEGLRYVTKRGSTITVSGSIFIQPDVGKILTRYHIFDATATMMLIRAGYRVYYNDREYDKKMEKHAKITHKAVGKSRA
jgi:hypothetical protein